MIRTRQGTAPRHRRGHQSPEGSHHEQRRAGLPSQGGRSSRARACWRSAWCRLVSRSSQWAETVPRNRLTSSQMDMTRTMGTAKAALSCSKPPTSLKRFLSSKTSNWESQNSGVMALLAGRPSKVGAGISMFLPSWTKNWLTLFCSKRVTTLFQN